jgi:hypothetical protein
VGVLHRKQLYLACFFCHLLLIFAICCRDTLSFIARGYTCLPVFFNIYAQKAETIVSTALGAHLEPSHPVRQAVSVYTHLGGIESGYAFFAPNVPDNYKLVFELHYPDGRIEYDLPHVASGGAGLRLATLLDNIGDTRSDELREVMVKMVAYSVWRAHPDATMIRAVFGFALLPTAAEFRRGTRESDEFLYAYDFLFPSSSGETDVP